MSKLMSRAGVAGNGYFAVDDQRPTWEDLLFRLVKDGKVRVGKDGWLFLDNDRNDFLYQYAGELKLSEPQLELWRELLETRLARVGELGARYHFLVAPESAAVYPEKLPDEIKGADERVVQQLMRHLSSKRSPARLIYPLEDLLADKSQRLVYRKTDTHWNAFGGFVAYRRLVRELAQDVPVYEVSEEELDFCEADLPGDLSYKLGVESGSTWFARYLYSRAHVVYDNRVYHQGSLIVTECPHAPPTKCVLFGDSSCSVMLNFLAQTFGRLVIAQSPTLDYDLISEERPDVVVTQMVERYLITPPDDSTARPIRAWEANKEAEERVRPRLRNWDPFPSLPAQQRPASIETVENTRAHLLSRGRQENAVLVSVMAYAGLSPAEALRLSWRQIENGILKVELPYAGRERPEYEIRERSVPILDALAEDLEQWRVACGSPQRGFVFPNLRKLDWPKWMRKEYRPAIRHAGRPDLGPSALCRTFAALLIHDGTSPSEVARLTGTTRREVTGRYCHLLDETVPNANTDNASDRIRNTRATSMAPSSSSLFEAGVLSGLWRGRLRPKGPGWDPLRQDSLGVRPLSVETVERIRARLLSSGHHEEATFVSAMAYSGLQQYEAILLRWRQVSDGALEIRRAYYDAPGNEDAEKICERSVPLLDTLAEDLEEWRAACGSPERGWVFPNLRERNWQEWIRRGYRRAAGPAGRGRRVPYYLRHTFCSLLIDQGASPDEVAQQMGLSRPETLRDYGHLFDKAREQEAVSASAQIRDARAAPRSRQSSGFGQMLGRLRRLPSAGGA